MRSRMRADSFSIVPATSVEIRPSRSASVSVKLYVVFPAKTSAPYGSPPTSMRAATPRGESTGVPAVALFAATRAIAIKSSSVSVQPLGA